MSPGGEEKRKKGTTKELQIEQPRVFTKLHKSTESSEHEPKSLEPSRMEQLLAASETGVVNLSSKDGNMEEKKKKRVENRNIKEFWTSTRPRENSVREAKLPSANKRKMFQLCRVGALPEIKVDVILRSIGSQDGVS